MIPMKATLLEYITDFSFNHILIHTNSALLAQDVWWTLTWVTHAVIDMQLVYHAGDRHVGESIFYNQPIHHSVLDISSFLPETGTLFWVVIADLAFLEHIVS